MDPCSNTAVLLTLVISLVFFFAVEAYDPDVDLTAPQIIRRHGYPAESHIVQTADGYLLSLHRIPCGVDEPKGKRQQRPVVFLQHGLLASSVDWIIRGPNESLSYILADDGFDVWMGNARGNTYSRAHTTWSTEDPRFWNFTWHEMAIYDLPAVIDYILDKTQQQDLFYIGHSMGTTMFFAMASSKPEYNSKVRAMFALAPVAYVSHMKSPIRIVAPWANDIAFITKFLGADAFLPQNKIVRLWARYGCLALNVQEEICENLIFVLCGFDKGQFNMDLMPVILSHTPAGASTKTLIHYAQEINSDKFQQFDYGNDKNIEIYNATSPPEYNLTSITSPLHLYYGNNDWLASEDDVANLYNQLPNTTVRFLVPFDGFNHVDFLWGKDAKTLLYNDILNRLHQNLQTNVS